MKGGFYMQHVYNRSGYKRTLGPNNNSANHRKAKKAIAGMHHNDKAMGHDARQQPMDLHQKSLFSSYDIFK